MNLERGAISFRMRIREQMKQLAKMAVHLGVVVIAAACLVILIRPGEALIGDQQLLLGETGMRLLRLEKMAMTISFVTITVMLTIVNRLKMAAEFYRDTTVLTLVIFSLANLLCR